MVKSFEIEIKPNTKWQLVNIGEIWQFRELFVIFSWRDLKVRYKQTFFGVAWVIFQPLVSTGIFTIFFGKLAKIPSNNIPYQLFVFIGLVFWIFFSSSLAQASNSMIENTNIIKKVYFPRLILPFSTIVTCFIDFSINFFVIITFVFFLGFKPMISSLIFIPLCLLIASISAAGIGLFLSAINVKYRDVKYILPFFIQTMLFVTPVIYPIAVIRHSYRYLMAFNPMAGVIETARVSLTSTGIIDYKLLAISSLTAILIFLFGLLFFRNTEQYFADIA